MVTYLIKSTLCLTLFLAFYHLVLEREKMHRFNRFYLLSSVLISFLAPLYTIYIKVIQEPVMEFTQLSDNTVFTEEIISIEEPVNYWNYVLYFSLGISALLLIRFFKNLYSIYRKISISEKFKHKDANIVLVEDNILPHTFWNYIFINKTAYETKELEQELFTHELTHVAQKHTFDVLLIELLKVVFWFNPVFYVLKKSVQLNHEFLADTNVVSQHKNVSKYQHLLINTSAWSNEYALASNLHYLVTKKRIVMMTKQTSKAVIRLKKLAVLPLIIGAIFLFAERIEAQEIVETIIEEKIPLKEEKLKEGNIYEQPVIEIVEGESTEGKSTPEYRYTKQTYWIKNKSGKKVAKKYYDLSEYYKKKWLIFPANPKIEKTIPESEFNSLKNTSFYVVRIDGIVIKNRELKNYKPTDFVTFSKRKISKLAKLKQEFHYNLITKKGLELIKFLDRYPKEEKTKSSKQSITPDPILKDIKLKLEDVDALKLSIINENYNALNKKYEKLRNQKPHFIKSSAERQTELTNLFSKLGGMYFKLSKADKKKVKRPIHPHNPYVILMKNNKVFYKLGTEITEEDKLLIPPPPIPNNATKEQKSKMKKAVRDWKKRTGNDFSTPPPPPPIMVKKGEKSNIPPPPPPKKTGQIKFKSKNNNQEVVTIDRINDLKDKEILDLPKNEDGKKATYYVDGKKMNYAEFTKFSKENNIEAKIFNTIHIKRNEDGTKSMYITTKKNKTTATFSKTKKNDDCLAFPESINLKGNEKLIVKCIENHPNNSLKIFNRWGNTVFSKENYKNNWNGKSKDKKLESGTYYYVFTSSKLKEQIKGWIHLKK